MMIRIMANKNRDSYKSNRAVTIETVRVARDWLKSKMEIQWEKLTDKSISEFFNNKQGFANAKTRGVGRDLIKKFLGRGLEGLGNPRGRSIDQSYVQKGHYCQTRIIGRNETFVRYGLFGFYEEKWEVIRS